MLGDMHGGSLLEREEYVQISHSVRYIAMKILLHTDLFLNCHCFVYIFFLFYIFSFFLQQSATQDILDKFDTSPLYFTRTRGLFRECFPGEKTNAPNDGVIGKYLLFNILSIFYFLLTRSSYQFRN